MKIVRHLPNALSLFRIFCIPFFFFFLLAKNDPGMLAVLLLGSVSDFLDGYLARKLRVESEIGALLDPLADKLFANSVLWGLYFFYDTDLQCAIMYLALASVLTLRDFVLLCGSFIVIYKRQVTNLKPIFISKLCTTSVFVFIISSIIFKYNCINIILGYMCLLLVILTFICYIIRFARNDANKSSQRL